MEMFEKASRLKLRFNTSRGVHSVEDLWDMTLEQLNVVAKHSNKKIKETAEEDFLKEKSTVDVEEKLKFDIVLYILNTKKEERDARKTAVKKKEKRDKLLELLEKKRDANREGMSEEDILKELDEL